MKPRVSFLKFALTGLLSVGVATTALGDDLAIFPYVLSSKADTRISGPDHRPCEAFLSDFNSMSLVKPVYYLRFQKTALYKYDPERGKNQRAERKAARQWMDSLFGQCPATRDEIEYAGVAVVWKESYVVEIPLGLESVAIYRVHQRRANQRNVVDTLFLVDHKGNIDGKNYQVMKAVDPQSCAVQDFGVATYYARFVMKHIDFDYLVSIFRDEVLLETFKIPSVDEREREACTIHGVDARPVRR